MITVRVGLSYFVYNTYREVDGITLVFESVPGGAVMMDNLVCSVECKRYFIVL